MAAQTRYKYPKSLAIYSHRLRKLMGKASRTKQERRTTVTEQKQSATGRNLWFIAAIAGVVVLGGLLAWLAISGKSDDTAVEIIPPARTESFDPATLTRNHIQSPTYDNAVPVGGDHIAIWQNCGVYREAQNTGNIVHSLEHGAVWVSYSPDISEAGRDKLEGLANLDPFVVVSPNDALGNGEVWSSAWGYRMQADSADDPRLDEFVNTFARGEQTPEPGATCTGGVGRPL